MGWELNNRVYQKECPLKSSKPVLVFIHRLKLWSGIKLLKKTIQSVNFGRNSHFKAKIIIEESYLQTQTQDFSKRNPKKYLTCSILLLRILVSSTPCTIKMAMGLFGHMTFPQSRGRNITIQSQIEILILSLIIVWQSLLACRLGWHRNMPGPLSALKCLKL